MKPPTVYKRSAEQVERLRKSHLGIRHSEEYRKRQSIIMKKIYSTPERRAATSKARKQYYLHNPSRKKEMSEYLIARYTNDVTFVESMVGGFWYGNVRYTKPPRYCEKFDNDFKERCRAFWGWECVVCGKKDITLSVHHVHYDKKMCCNGSPKDVVALCRGCHTATNYNRDIWEDLFTRLIYEDCNGRCYYTQEEFKNISK